MSTDAQFRANQQNCLHSTGPKTAEGKAESCLNNVKYGLTGNSFSVLAWENEEDYNTLHSALKAQLEPRGPFERLTVEKMAQHQWLAQRALVLQEMCFDQEVPNCDNEKKLALYLRYQTTHERAYHKYFDQLLKLRAEVRKQEIGFESQERKRNKEAEQETEAARKQETHEARIRLAHAKAAHLELDTEIRSTIEAHLPGHAQIPFDHLKSVLTVALEAHRPSGGRCARSDMDVARHMAAEKAA